MSDFCTHSSFFAANLATAFSGSFGSHAIELLMVKVVIKFAS